MSSVSEATYSRNSVSTVSRSCGQRASVMRMVIVPHTTCHPGRAQREPGSPSSIRARERWIPDSRFAASGMTACGLSVHALEELAVGLGVAQLVEQEVDCIHRAHRIEDAAQDVHLLELLRLGEQLFLARAGARDVDRREGALVGHLAIEDELGVTGSLELL